MSKLRNDIEAKMCYLGEGLDVLSLICQEIEDEGCVSYTEISEEARAIIFIRRLPMFVSALRLVCRDFDNHLKDMEQIIDATYLQENKKELHKS